MTLFFNSIQSKFNKIRKFSKVDFTFIYVIPLFTFLFAVVLLNRYMVINFSKSDLRKNSGIVEEARNVYYLTDRRYRHHTKNDLLVIGLKNFKDGFLLKERFKASYNTILSNILPGDTVSIYTRQDLFRYLPYEKSNEIYQIEKRGNIVFDLKTVQKEYRQYFNYEFILLLILLIMIITYRYLFTKRAKIVSENHSKLKY